MSKTRDIIEVINLTRSIRRFDRYDYVGTIESIERKNFTGKYRDVAKLLVAVCKHHNNEYDRAEKLYEEVLSSAEKNQIIDTQTSKYISLYINNIIGHKEFKRNKDLEVSVDKFVLHLFPFKNRDL